MSFAIETHQLSKVFGEVQTDGISLSVSVPESFGFLVLNGRRLCEQMESSVASPWVYPELLMQEKR
jgi:hypothetical protein